MGLFDKFIPDCYFQNFNDIPDDFFSQRNIKFFVCDIDNTLVTYSDPTPTENVLAFFSKLQRQDIKIAFVSNNNIKRVSKFCADLPYAFVANANKPSTRGLKSVMESMGAEKHNTVFMGDQIFTDVFCGKRAGVLTIYVPPIKDKKDIFTKFKRLLEKPFLKKIIKKEKIKES